MNMTYVQLLPNDSSVNGNVHDLIIYVQMRRHLAGDQVERSAGSLLQRKTVQLPTTLHEPPAAYVRQSSESRRKGSTTMLAELFMLRLEARLRTSREPTSFTKSDTRFIPIKQPNPEKEEKPQTDK